MFEIREVQRPQGPRKLAAERQHYFELVDQGISSMEACRIVGVNVKTGREWRNGRSRRASDGDTPRMHPRLAPVRREAGSARYLSADERITIADLLLEGKSIRAIAAFLGRSASTVSREVRRNAPAGSRYRPFRAHASMQLRRPRPKVGKIDANPELAEFVQGRLMRKWSPEQIAQALRVEHPERPEMHVVHETIYQALYSRHRSGLTRDLGRHLRRGRLERKQHRRATSRRQRFVTPMVLIDRRPAEVESRAVPGHWEGDLIIGRNSASAIGTLVERTSRYTRLVHLPRGRSSFAVRDALIDSLQALPAHLRGSLTWDQGIELSRHHEVTQATGIGIYFCNPASPWQRGSNENTNGLLRQYFPKATSLAVPLERLQQVADELNDRPRKSLGWRTPAAVFAELAAAG